MRIRSGVIAVCMVLAGMPAAAQDTLAQDDLAQYDLAQYVQPQPVPSSAEQRAMEVKVQEILQTCYVCHGEGAVSALPTRPTIAGQPAVYIAQQMRAFKRAAQRHLLNADSDEDAGQMGNVNLAGRADAIMEHMTPDIPDDVIGPLAEAISRMPCDGGTPKSAPATPPAPPPVARRCDACHGVDGIGSEPFMPKLAGQQRSYLRRQLLLIREVAWGAEPREGEAWRNHPIMDKEAGRLSIEDVDALARYYAALSCRGAAPSSN